MISQLISLTIASAWATSTYPAAVQAELDMPCAPTCTLCHATNAGGAGTVVSNFGLAMFGEHGLTGGGNVASVTAALAEMEVDQVDSDNDGTIDIAELAEGRDPNPDAAPFCDLVLPIYGCFGPAEGSAAGMGLMALLGLTTLRRRTSGRPR